MLSLCYPKTGQLEGRTVSKVLTQRAVETAKPKQKRYGKPDGIVSGQRLLVQPSGEKSYVILPRIHGKQVTITLGNAALLSLADARIKGKAVLTAIANGEDPRQAKQDAAKAASVTVELIIRRFIERHAKVHNKSWEGTERVLEREVLKINRDKDGTPSLPASGSWAKRPITSIRKPDVVALLDAIV